MFNYDIFPKRIAAQKTWQDWHFGKTLPGIQDIAAALDAIEIQAHTTEMGHPVMFYGVGNSKAKHKVLVKGGHEDEFTYLPSIHVMMASLLNDTEQINKLLSKVQLWFIECDKPDDFNRRQWTTVDMECREVPFPPELFDITIGSDHPIDLIAMDVIGAEYTTKAGVTYRDENGVYGDPLRSQRIWDILEVIDKEIQSLSVVIDLHATYRTLMSGYVYHGAGILEIGHYPIDQRVLDRIYSMADAKKPWTVTGWISIVPFIRRLMQGNRGFELGKAAMENVKQRGLKIYDQPYQALLESPSILSQLIAVDTGRTTMGKIYREADIQVCSEYLSQKYDECLGYTTETFPMAMPDVILQNVAYVEGMLKYICEGKLK